MLLDRPSGHSVEHGKELLLKLAFRKHLTSSGKRLRAPAKPLQFLQVEADSVLDSSVQLHDVMVDGPLSGFDLLPEGEL